MNRAERRQQAKEDAKRLAHGIDSRSEDAEPTAAMARQLLALFEEAKRDRNIAPAMRFLYAKVEATIAATREINVACKMGCSHCCHSWVSAPAPEILFLAKRLVQRQAGAADKIKAANALTKDVDYVSRRKHSLPCPLLEQDACSAYELRPTACRFASSANALICARAFRQGMDDPIPTPVVHLRGRSGYQIALAIALKNAGLPHHFYELNAGLVRALEVEDAERAWLAGDDIFFDVPRDPTDILAQPQTKFMYRHAFGSSY